MPTTPITIPVVPSRLVWWSHALLGVAVLAVLARYGSPQLALVAAAWVALMLGYLAYRPLRGELQLVPEQEGKGRWFWRAWPEGECREVVLHCRYLGPWLIALQLGGEGRTLWLWPDSSRREALHRLRRWLVQHS
ncbi:hypothetical protein HOP52_00605 [Halomonas campisalis]|uniref:Toxin CptA n=1 Tax=Billgrantia campisalis TaxID=74661 RepID=A0ABS9P3B4_9GAMM|nr:protein YgfX [Halomonas campisalis]MCG6656277.1 hypothetical protein [Halomonas campisalis]MDR5861464.1 hypothetical protein [Halomonas campisalis]